MSLNHILEAIKKEATEEAEKIKKESQEKIEILRKEFNDREKIAKAEILAKARQEAKRKTEQAKFQSENAAKALLLTAKQSQLKEIFQAAARKLAAKPAHQQIELLVKLMRRLPPEKEGKIVATKNSAGLLKKTAEKSGRSFPLAAETAEGSGGFVFVSPKMEIDNRYESLIEALKEEMETEVAKILFS